MNWKLKAIMQTLIDMLPFDLSYHVYYRIQRSCGALKTVNPLRDFEKSIYMLNAIKQQNHKISGKDFLEIGTGRTINVPIGLWLCGASRIITVDVNPYLKEELVLESIDYIRQCRAAIKRLFGNFSKTVHFMNRLDQLIYTNGDLNTFLELMNIEYLAPADASFLHIENDSIDFFFTVNVFEHIPADIIKNILLEAKRVLRKDGLMIHRIDLSDHFSHSDRSITAINFLRFSEKQWNTWAGNRFMYHNRLRAYEFYELFEQQDVNILDAEELVDERACALLQKGFPLDNRFVEHSPKALAVSGLNIVGTF